MALEFKLPDIGEGIAEGEIVKWLVKTGDTVEEHQAVVEVMTDKATVEVPAPRAGKIVSLNAKEGEVVPVGNVIFVLETGAGATAAPAPQAAPAAAAAPAPAPAPAAKGSGGRLEFRLPDIGEGIAEGEIVKWLVKAGDSVEEHQAVVEVMTDKATVEVPAPRAGRIVSLNAKEGEVVPVGNVIFVLEGAAGGAAAAHAPAAASAQAPAAALPSAPSHSAPAGRPEPVLAAAGAGISRPSGKVLAVPSARRVARELSIDLSQVPGSGRNGTVRRADVEAFAKGGAAAPAARPAGQPAAQPAAASAQVAAPKGPVISLAPGQAETRVPFRGVRRKISEAMVRSKYTAPHFTVVEELDVTELVRLRERAKAMGAKKGVKVTYMPFIMKACANALKEFPMLNSKLDEASQELVTYHHVNLGIATDTPNGLIVPVLKNVEQKSVMTLAKELAELAERTRAGKMSSEDLRGSTFSITNAGNIGGILATPIINFPDAAILGVHRIVKRPGVVETPEGDRIEVRQYMNLSVSVDHRLVDGADGARFLVHMKELLEQPGLLSL